MADSKNPDASDDTNFFWQTKYGSENSRNGDYLVDASDAYANLHKFYISFYHLPSDKTVFFKAFITAYREDFVSNWSEAPVYGRTDSIVTYSNTRRKVSLSFSVPAASESEAYENMGRLQRLIQFQYPGYHRANRDNVDDVAAGAGDAFIIGQSPLVRLKMMNLLSKTEVTTAKEYQESQDKPRSRLIGEYVDEGTAADGLLVAIQNLSIDSEIDKVAVFEKDKGTVMPQSFRVTLDFLVIHDHTIGFNEEGEAIQNGFPWNVTLKEPTAKEQQMTFNNTDGRINMTLNNQAAEDIAKARYSGMFGKRRAAADIKRAEKRHYKSDGKDVRIQEGGFDYELAHEAKEFLSGE